MREIHPDLAPYWLGGLLQVASVDGGPTDEQLRIIQGLLRGYFGIDGALDLQPLPAEAISAYITDPASRHRMVETLIVLEFARHPASEQLVGAVESYAATLGIDEPMLLVARRAAEQHRELLMDDWRRFGRPTPVQPALRGRPEAETAERLAALRECPPGTLGRAFADFYQRWGLDYPTVAETKGLNLISHDFSHVLSGYLPNDAIEEVALSAMIVSATDGESHFSALTASMALYEAGLFDALDITPTTGVLGRPGSPEVFADAMRRGASCTTDFVALDHLALADEPLEKLRDELGIPPRAA
jgi:ubiquinone biosynthesis protein Coq4